MAIREGGELQTRDQIECDWGDVGPDRVCRSALFTLALPGRGAKPRISLKPLSVPYSAHAGFPAPVSNP
jgi:hypothetical protein